MALVISVLLKVVRGDIGLARAGLAMVPLFFRSSGRGVHWLLHSEENKGFGGWGRSGLWDLASQSLIPLPLLLPLSDLIIMFAAV